MATISGQVFNDLNANGLKDTGESGQSGWTVYLDADGNGQLGTGETSTTTAADGSYSFNGLAAGTYTVAEVQQSGWQQTSPAGTVPSIERVSVADDGTQGNDVSSVLSISADGRYVAFTSNASNLVPGDTNGFGDIFVYDRQTDTIERVSVASDGTQGNDRSVAPSISADGRYVAFVSYASNLVPGDTNGASDIFVYDRQTDTIERVSLAADGTEGDRASDSPSISADGRYVAFVSYASNLVSGDTNGETDVFVYDRQTDTIERVSVASDGTQANGYSHTTLDQRRRPLCGVFLSGQQPRPRRYQWHDTTSSCMTARRSTIERVSVATDGTQGNGSVMESAIDQRRRPLCGIRLFRQQPRPRRYQWTNRRDVFVYDRQTDTIERVSLAADGTQGKRLFRLSLDQRRRPLCGVPVLPPATSSPAIPMASTGRLRV